MADSYILEKVFRTLTGLKFETCWDLFDNKVSRCNLVLSGNSILKILLLYHRPMTEKELQQIFYQPRRHFISFCKLFVAYFFRKLINFRSGCTIKLKLFYSFWIVKNLSYFKYSWVGTIVLHYLVNNHVSFLWFFDYIYVAVFKFFYLVAFFNNNFTIIN